METDDIGLSQETVQLEGDTETEAAAAGDEWQFEPPQPTTAVDTAPREVKFRIGSQRNGFIYTGGGFTYEGNPVYQCTRGSGLRPRDVYWLYRCQYGSWICVEANKETSNPIQDGAPQFKTAGNYIEDISEECEALAWHHWDESGKWWSTSTMTFPTTRL